LGAIAVSRPEAPICGVLPTRRASRGRSTASRKENGPRLVLTACEFSPWIESARMHEADQLACGVRPLGLLREPFALARRATPDTSESGRSRLAPELPHRRR